MNIIRKVWYLGLDFSSAEVNTVRSEQGQLQKATSITLNAMEYFTASAHSYSFSETKVYWLIPVWISHCFHFSYQMKT